MNSVSAMLESLDSQYQNIFGEREPVPVRISIKPSEIDTPPVEPLPSRFTTPVPFGRMSISPLDVDTILLPFTSKSPPSCGVVSDTMFR